MTNGESRMDDLEIRKENAVGYLKALFFNYKKYIEELEHQIELLKNENNELKKQLEEKPKIGLLQSLFGVKTSN